MADIPLDKDYLRKHYPDKYKEPEKKKDKCFYREVSRDLQKKYQQTVYPVCPALREWINEKEAYRLAVASQVFNRNKKRCYSTPGLLMWDSIVRILIVFENLIKLKPDFQTIVKCAHTENFLKGRLDLIRNDLSALPQSLEKDFPTTSNECKELIEELKIAELAYGVQSHVYLVPHNLENGNWITFLAWRDQQINPTHFCSRIEILNLTSYYPAEAIKVMHTLHKKLSPLAVKILPEQALVKNQLKADFKKMFEEFSARLAQTKPASNNVEKPEQNNKKPLKMIRPTIKNIVEIIEKLKTLKEKQAAFVNVKGKALDSDKLADGLATCLTRKPYTGSIEELIKASAGLDAKLSEPLLMEDILAGGMPTKTLAEFIPTLPIDKLQRLLNKFLPELESTEIPTDIKYRLQKIKADLSCELGRKENHKDGAAKIISTMNNYEENRTKSKGYWPKHIQDLVDNIDILLSPYLDYLKEKGSWGKSESGIIAMKIKSGRPVDLNDVTHELEKIKHKMEIESQQLISEKPVEPEPNIKPKAETWSQVSIDVLDNDAVRYKVAGKQWKRAGYAELGFANKLKGLPNQLWPIFRGMAKHSSGGYVKMYTTKNISKDVDRIRTTLRNFFGIKEIPIKYIKNKKAYKVYFNFSYKQNS